MKMLSNGSMLHALQNPLLASAPAMRPVFLIVMGAFLLLTAWRMTRGTTGWTPRVLMCGAVMLAIGYAIIMPLYHSGVLVPISRIGSIAADPATVLFWHALKTTCMNGGWLIFGTGLAMHAGIFETTTSAAPVQSPRTSPQHEPLS